MSSDYYNLEEASSVLGLPTAEILRLRDNGKLRAYRDGASWKFKKNEVDNHLVGMIKGRSKSASGEDGEYDLLAIDEEDDGLSLADVSSFDAILAETPLDLDGEPTGSAAKEAKEDDFFALADDDLAVADDELSLASSSAPASKSTSAEVPSAAQALADEDEDMFLEMDEDDDLLAIISDDMGSESDSPFPIDDDFDLTPNAASPVDDSESSSQVIPLDDDMFGSAPINDSTTFGGASLPFGGANDAAASSFANFAPASSIPVAALETEYDGLSLGMLIVVAVCLAFSGLVMLDLIIHMWSWGEPYTVTGPFISLFTGGKS